MLDQNHTRDIDKYYVHHILCILFIIKSMYNYVHIYIYISESLWLWFTTSVPFGTPILAHCQKITNKCQELAFLCFCFVFPINPTEKLDGQHDDKLAHIEMNIKTWLVINPQPVAHFADCLAGKIVKYYCSFAHHNQHSRLKAYTLEVQNCKNNIK